MLARSHPMACLELDRLPVLRLGESQARVGTQIPKTLGIFHYSRHFVAPDSFHSLFPYRGGNSGMETMLRL